MTQHPPPSLDPPPTPGPSFGAGWLVLCIATLLAVATAIECHVVVAGAYTSPSWFPSLIYGSVLWFWWAALALLLWKTGSRTPALWRTTWLNGLAQLLTGLVIAIVHLKTLQIVARLMILRWPYLEQVGYGKLDLITIERTGLEILLYMVVWGASAAVYMQIDAQRKSMQTAQLKQQLASAHLLALQMQMEPHFLFNTLNAITTLVEFGRQQEAIATLAHLNTILKSTLQQSTPQKVSLAQELTIVENYLAIEQIRFADRLHIELSIDPTALNGLVPSFLLQPIVENAIRHGIAHMEDGGIIQASVQRKQNRLHLSVHDNGPGLTQQQSHPGHGIGLQNTEQRLSHLYPGQYRFSAMQPERGGFEVSISIPYEPIPA